MKSHHEHIEKKKKEFMDELRGVFQSMIEENMPWYNKTTTVFEEIVNRFEKIFGKV